MGLVIELMLVRVKYMKYGSGQKAAHMSLGSADSRPVANPFHTVAAVGQLGSGLPMWHVTSNVRYTQASRLCCTYTHANLPQLHTI